MASFQFYPATAERWSDLEHLFGKMERTPAAGSFRMFWRLERALIKKTKGESTRAFWRMEGRRQWTGVRSGSEKN